MSTPTPHTGPDDQDDDGQTDNSTATATMTDDGGLRKLPGAAVVSDNEREERMEAYAEDPAAASAGDVVVMGDTSTSASTRKSASSSLGDEDEPAVPQSPSANDDGEGGGRTATVMTSAAAERTTPPFQQAEEDTDAGHRPREATPLTVADEWAAGGDDGNGDGAGGSGSANRTEAIDPPLEIPLPAPPSAAVAGASVEPADEYVETPILHLDSHPEAAAGATDASTATPKMGSDVDMTTSAAEMSQPALMEEETKAVLGSGEESRTTSAVVTDEIAPGDDVGLWVPLAGTSRQAPAQPVAADEAKGATPAPIEVGPGGFRDDSRSPRTAMATAVAAPRLTPASASVTSPPSRSAFSPGAMTPSSTADAAGADDQQQSSSSSSSSVRVAVRVRPLLPSEVGSSHCVTFPTPNRSIQLGGSANATFSFDHALDTTTTQRRVYDECVRPLVTSCLGGYNATVLAYGQTGSGKTYTILGDDDDDDDGDQEEDDVAKDGAAMDDADGRSVGVIPRALRELFERLERTKAEALASASPTAAAQSPCSPSSQTSSSSSPAPPFDYEVRVQFLELYGEDIRDLLFHCAPPPSSKKNHHQTPGSRLVIRDAAGANSDEPEVVGATEHPVESAGEALDLLALGTARRVTGATAMNEVSSRSHAIMTVVVEQTTIITSGGGGDGDGGGGGGEVEEVETRRSKFHFVDLAGSERQKRSLAEGKRLKEGIDINKGLLVLGNVISALGDAKKRGKTFVPYRDSKLTRLLRGSLGGNHKTLMIACVSPSSLNMEESLSCLRYANRARNIQNNAVINVDEGSRLLSELRSKVSALASELLRVRGACLSHAEECSSVDAQLLDGGAFTDAMLRSLAQGATGTVSKKDGPNLSCDMKSAQIDRRRPQSRYFEEKSATPSLRLPKEEYGKRRGVEDSEVTRTTQEGAGRNNKKCGDNTEEKEVPLQPAPKLTSLQAALLRSSEGKTESAAIKKKEKVDLPDLPSGLREKQWEAGDGGSPIEQEEAEEQAELRATTKKFVPDSDSEVENDVAVGRREVESSEINADVGRHDDDVNSSFSRRQRHMNAAISELTKTISSKEELIEQLVSSQEKYEEMQDFYEEKLQEMEVLLQENEVERDDLINEMKKLEEDSQNAAVLKKSLRSKERHIAELKRKQMELQSLTKVSASNVSMIAKLRNEITDLKRKRIEIQKESANEKKAHAKEIRALKKEGQQRDRELTKWKQESTKRAIQAENAQKIAKLRLEEMGRVRTKYREAEQRLRMQTLKRGVMAKAGIDAVMVGRQDTSSFSPASSRKRTGKKSSLDVNRMRHFLDGKVSEVGKAEAAADKLAQEWEEHMNLVARKEELMSGSMDDAEVSEQLDALRVQIQFKEQRIRQLSSRIIPPTGSVKAHKKTSLSIVLDDKDFKRMCAGNSPLSIAQATAKVLFGMVVRERKRVAGLARVASSLDQKVADAEKNVVSKEAAFRSHIDEQMQERANMARQQQEQIVALMAMVREEAVSGGESDDVVEGGDQSLGDSELMHSPMKGAVSDEKRLNHVLSVAMSLSNMRIDALERELSELSDERKLMEGYKAREEEASKLLEDTQQDCESLRRELRQLRVSLRQIKKAVGADIPEKVNVQGSGGTGLARSKPADTPAQVTAIVDKALHSSEMSRFDRGFEVEDDSSGSEVGDAPAWANDIMADLQLIAEGGVPQSLLQDGAQPFSDKNDVDALNQTRQSSTKHDSQKRPKKGIGNEKLQKDADVFERLTDPSNFTGIQKHCFLENDMSPTALRDGTQVLPNSTDKTEDSGNTKQQSKKTDTARQPGIDSNEPQRIKKGTGVLEGLTDSDRIAGDRTSIEGDNSEARSSRTVSRTVVNYKKPSDSAVAGNKSFSPSVNDLIRQFDGELSYASGPSNSSLLRQESMEKVACKGSEVPVEEGRVVLHAKKEHSTSSAGQQNTVEGPSHNNRCQESEALSAVSSSGKECESHADFSPGAPVANKETECAEDEFHAKAVKVQDTFGFEGHSQESCITNGFERHEMIGNVGETNVASIQTSTGVPNVAETLEDHENGESQERRKLFDLGSEFSEEQQNTKHQQNVPTESFQRGQNLITSSAVPKTGNNQTGLVEERNKILQLSPVSSQLEDNRAGQKYEMHRREDSMHSSLRRVPPNLRKKGPNDVSMDEKSCGDSLDEKPRMSSLQSALRRLRKKKASPRSKRPEV